MDALDVFASKCQGCTTSLGRRTRGQVAFLAVAVDDAPPPARRARAKWPHLDHYWLDAPGLVAARVAFVPNRALVSNRGQVHRWWDGTGGNVLKGPHGASRANGSRSLLDEIAQALPN